MHVCMVAYSSRTDKLTEPKTASFNLPQPKLRQTVRRWQPLRRDARRLAVDTEYIEGMCVCMIAFSSRKDEPIHTKLGMLVP
jgi:hypothetical protein